MRSVKPAVWVRRPSSETGIKSGATTARTAPACPSPTPDRTAPAPLLLGAARRSVRALCLPCRNDGVMMAVLICPRLADAPPCQCYLARMMPWGATPPPSAHPPPLPCRQAVAAPVYRRSPRRGEPRQSTLTPVVPAPTVSFAASSNDDNHSMPKKELGEQWGAHGPPFLSTDMIGLKGRERRVVAA